MSRVHGLKVGYRATFVLPIGPRSRDYCHHGVQPVEGIVKRQLPDKQDF